MAIDKNKIVRKDLTFKIKEIKEDKYTIKGVFSTSAEDRHGEIIDQTGWNIKEFMENPVVLFGHNQYIPAVGKVIELEVDGSGNLAGTIEFAVEQHELAKTIFGLYKGGFMRAFSVGFRCDKFEVNEDDDSIILRENTLFELSCVNVPANAMALASTKGLDMQPVRDAVKKEVQKKIEDGLLKNKVDLSTETINQITDQLKEKISKVLSADNVGRKPAKTKGETPANKGGKRQITARKVNKVVRELLQEKRALKN